MEVLREKKRLDFYCKQNGMSSPQAVEEILSLCRTGDGLEKDSLSALFSTHNDRFLENALLTEQGYQDISRQRFDLVKALREVCDARVIAVGDDWQSIYAFSGSDISLVTEFEKRMGPSALLRIENTYRNAQELIDIAGSFIQKNPSQIVKTLHSDKRIVDPVLIYTYNAAYKRFGADKNTGAYYKTWEKP